MDNLDKVLAEVRQDQDTIYQIIRRLYEARIKHPASQWQGSGKYWALGQLEAEVNELRHALEHETDQRITDEALDVIAVAIRIINREYD